MAYKFDPETVAKICGEVLDVPLGSWTTGGEAARNTREPAVSRFDAGRFGKLIAEVENTRDSYLEP